MLGVPGPVEGRFDNAPAHLIIISPKYSSSYHLCRYGDRSEEHEDAMEERKEAAHLAAVAREEARLETRRVVAAEKKKQLASEKEESDRISKARQIERRLREAASSQKKPKSTEEERKRKKQKYNRDYIQKMRLLRENIPEDARGTVLASIPEGWMNLANASKSSGVAYSTASKYRASGLIQGIKTPFGVFIDPNELREVFGSRQKSYKNYLKDRIHEVMKARFPFCETVDQ